MPITGTIQADYSDFVNECKKAEAGLAGIEKQGKSTGDELAGMESKIATGKLDAAISKTIDKVDKAGQSAKASGNSFGVMADGLRVADKTLSQFGVNLGPTIGTLQELSQVSTMASGSIGLIGKASLVASAAMAAWKITQFVREISDADKVMADLGSSIMGWGSAASETLKARMDVIRKAYEQGYEGAADFDKALKFVNDRLAENIEKTNTGAGRVTEWRTQILHAKGGVAELRKEIEGGNSTTEQMAKHFNVSAEAIAYLKREMDAEKDVARDMASAHEKLAAEQKKVADEAKREADAIQKLQDAMFGTDTIEKSQQYLTALGGVNNLTRMSKEAQASMNTELGKAIDAYSRMGQIAPQAIRDVYTATLPLPPIVAGLGSEWASVGEKVTVNADKIIADMKRLQQETKDYEAETQRMAEAFSESQKAVDKGGQSMDRTAQSARGLVVEMNAVAAAGIHVRDAWEEIAAGNYLMEQYAKTGVAMGQQIATGGYTFQQLKDVGVKPTYGLAQPLDTTTPWGNQNTLNVNVNSTDAQDIAGKLVTEMKRSGYRL